MGSLLEVSCFVFLGVQYFPSFFLFFGTGAGFFLFLQHALSAASSSLPAEVIETVSFPVFVTFLLLGDRVRGRTQSLHLFAMGSVFFPTSFAFAF